MCHMNDDGGLTSNEYIYIFHGANRIELCIWKPQQLQGFTSHWFKLNYGLVPGFLMSQIKIAVTSHKQNSHSQQIHLKQPSAI